MLERRTVDEWCEAIAGPSASPAGGSAAAIATGLAAALVEMVAGLTSQREKYADVHDRARAARPRAADLRQRLLELAARDAEALARFTRALSLPQTSEADRQVRAEAKRSALRDAAVVQIDLLGHAADVADLAVVMAEGGLASALGDSATAGFLSAGAARSAYWAIRSDLQSAGSDPEVPARLERALSLLERVEAAEWRVRQILSERVR
jgi:glutamate formiminotransferase/formiminotetrahydrofolate cyclodeaminase